MTPISVPFSKTIGTLLIVAPLLGIAFKMFSFGWMMFFVIFGPIFIMVAGYIVQIIIAAQGFFSTRDLFGAGAKRAAIAALTTSIGIVLLGIFMQDGGDVGYGSTLQVWLGSYGEHADAVHAATDGLTDVVAILAAVAWVGGFLWLFAEWIFALGRRRRRKLATA